MIQPWNLSWHLARRFRQRQQRSGFLSFISASSTLGIALGCMVFITGLSVMNGFEKVLQERFLSLTAQVEFTAVESKLKNPEALIKASLAHPEVVSATAVIRTQAMIQQGTEFTGVQIHGVDTNQPQAIQSYVSEATWSALKTTINGMVMGSQLAAKLGLQPGDKLVVLVGQNGNFREPKRQRLELVGTFNFGGQIDHQFAYVTLATARQLIGIDDGVTAVELKLKDIFQAQQIATQLGQQIHDYVYLDHWMRSQGHLYRDIQLVRLVMYMVLLLVLAVACFNIVSTLIMTVQEKQRHIGILRTMGLRASVIMRVFIWQGVQNGLLGVAVGIISGVSLTLVLPLLMEMIEQLSSSTILASDVYFVDYIPTDLQWLDVVVVALVALLMSVLATIYPAWRAAKTEIIQAINA